MRGIRLAHGYHAASIDYVPGMIAPTATTAKSVKNFRWDEGFGRRDQYQPKDKGFAGPFGRTRTKCSERKFPNMLCAQTVRFNFDPMGSSYLKQRDNLKWNRKPSLSSLFLSVINASCSPKNRRALKNCLLSSLVR
jgi:hypothetical protein